MIDTPEIVTVPAQAIAVIKITIARDRMREVMGPGVAELMSTVSGQGIHPVGPWFTHHFKMSPETFDFEIGVPVPKPIVPAGRVVNSERPSFRAARSILRGSYENLHKAWPELDAWIDAQGLKAGPALWETYVKDPGQNPDPATWETELVRPLAD